MTPPAALDWSLLHAGMQSSTTRHAVSDSQASSGKASGTKRVEPVGISIVLCVVMTASRRWVGESRSARLPSTSSSAIETSRKYLRPSRRTPLGIRPSSVNETRRAVELAVHGRLATIVRAPSTDSKFAMIEARVICAKQPHPSLHPPSGEARDDKSSSKAPMALWSGTMCRVIVTSQGRSRTTSARFTSARVSGESKSLANAVASASVGKTTEKSISRGSERSSPPR